MSTNMKIEKLLRLLASIDNATDLKALMDDLCTTKELENMAERLYAAELLMEGKTYKLDRGRNTPEAKRRQLTRDYLEDYERWKLAFAI